MIKWKLYKSEKSNIKEVMDVTISPTKIWLERLEDHEVHFHGLLKQNTRKLNAVFSLESANDMKINFGMDFEKKFTKALADEIRREMDQELIKDLLGGKK